MPRPDITAKKPGATGNTQSKNFIANWLQNRKERRMQAENQAARMIANSTAKNEQLIISTLDSIDFINSKLPKNILENKLEPQHPCGELEYVSRTIISTIRNTQTIPVNIRAIDEKILALALLFKDSVEKGQQEAAYAAKAALWTAIDRIRSKVPTAQPELLGRFVETNTEYLRHLITLVYHAQEADMVSENIALNSQLLQEMENKHEENRTLLKSKIKNDARMSEAYESLRERTTTTDRARWTREERTLHNQLVEQAMEKVNLDLRRSILQQQELALITTKAEMDVLFNATSNLPIPTDPDRMNKFQEAVNSLFENMQRTDKNIEDALNMMAKIEGQLDQLDSARGNTLAMEIAAEEAEAVLAEIHADQKIETGETEGEHKKRLREMGILSEEEIAEQRLQHKQREAMEERQREEEKVQEEERERLVN